MTTLSSPKPIKPQSIVHQIGRMGSLVASPFVKSKSQKNLRASISKVVKSLSCSELTQLTADLTLNDESMSSEEIGESSLRSCDLLRESPSPQHNYVDDFFVHLDQNEFLMECLLTNKYSDMTFIVHFYAEDSQIAEAIEDCIVARSIEAGSQCQLRRVNAKLAPLFTKKLGIDAEQSTVVAIRNGSVISRISDISSSACWELDKWLTNSGVLEKKECSSEFLSLNTLSC